MAHVDTSLLVHALSTSEGRALLCEVIERGDRLVMSTVVEYEWLRGPRTSDELAVTATLFPTEAIVPFESGAARTAARLYRHLPRARPRQIDIMIAACAIEHGAALWTLNPEDFRDIPGLVLYALPA